MADSPADRRGAGEIPDLDLSAQPATGALERPLTLSKPDYDFELDSPEASSPAFDLDAGAPTGSPAPAMAERAQLGRLGQLDGGALDLDPIEVSLVAAFGPPPKHWLLGPVYAWRVRTRQRTLRRELVVLEAERAAAARTRDDLLVSLVTEKRAAIEADERLNRVLDPARKLEHAAGERGQALARANAEYSEKARELEGKLVEAREPVAVKKSEEQARLQEFIEREQAHKRAEARHKRVFIEIRSVRQVAAQAALGQGLPEGHVLPEHAARIEELSADGAALMPELDALAASVEAARAALEAARRDLAQSTRAMRLVEAERRALDQQFQKQLDARAQGFNEVEHQRHMALADAARVLLAMPAISASIAIEPPTLAALLAADEALRNSAAAAEKHLRAAFAYDPRALRQGELLAGGVVALVVVLVLLWIVL